MSDRQATPSSRPKLRLKGMPLGSYETNAYVAWLDGGAGIAEGVEGETACWLIDAPFDSEEMVDLVRSENLSPTLLLLTHAHVDHIAGVRAIRAAFPEIKIAIHRLEERWLTDPTLNLSVFTGQPVTAPPADMLLEDRQRLTLTTDASVHASTDAPDGVTFEVIHVPGHSPGSVAFFASAAGVCIGGDALFAGSIGRTDFPGCSSDELLRSIRTRLLALPGETRLYPGHGGATTIARERDTNPFLRS